MARAREAASSGDAPAAAAQYADAAAVLRAIETPPGGAASLLTLHAETRYYATMLRRRLATSG